MMINFNGTILSKNTFILTHNNRGFKYGDSIFETLKVKNGRVVFWEDHYFRLMASMRMLRMEIPLSFTLEFLQDQILKTCQSMENQDLLRVRLSVFRKDGGLYAPKSNEIDYLVEVEQLKIHYKKLYRVDLYKDFYNYSGMLSTVKTNNKMLHTVASVYAKENDLDNCILLNERKGVSEFINGNLFLIKGDVIKTPPLTEGCLKGIARKKVIDILQKNPNFTLEENPITPFEIQKADEVFLTNSIVGIQSVTHYRKKVFSTAIAQKIQQNLSVLELLASD